MVRKSIRAGAFARVSLLLACSAWAQSETMDELYKKALKEGGTLNFYGTLAQISAALEKDRNDSHLTPRSAGAV